MLPIMAQYANLQGPMGEFGRAWARALRRARNRGRRVVAGAEEVVTHLLDGWFAPRRRRARTRPRWARRRRSRGQAMLEFALVAGPLFACIFGVIEFSLINTSIGSYNFGVKEGARLGSVLGRQDQNADSKIISLVQSRVNGFVMARMTKLEIYDADPYTGNVLTSGSPAVAMDDVYTFDSSGNQTSSTAPWPPNSRNDTLADADYVGVRATFSYTYLTAFLTGSGAQLTLTALSVQRIEPLDYSNADVAPSRPSPLAAASPHVDRYGSCMLPGSPDGLPVACTTFPVWRADERNTA